MIAEQQRQQQQQTSLYGIGLPQIHTFLDIIPATMQVVAPISEAVTLVLSCFQACRCMHYTFSVQMATCPK